MSAAPWLTAGQAAAETLAGRLVVASLTGALFVLAVWLVCRLAPRLPAGLRCALWWAACLKLLLGLTGISTIVGVPLPVLPAAPGEQFLAATAQLGRTPAPAKRLAPRAGEVAGTLHNEVVGISAGAGSRSGWHPASVAKWLALGRPALAVAVWVGVGLWLIGVVVQLGLVLRDLGRARGVRRRSSRVEDGHLRGLFAELSAAMGMQRLPELRCSAEVGSPLALGLARPVVLLPRADLERLSGEELAMTLCHELAHVRRRDLWLGWVPAVAERLFFFHPLAALAAREYALAREAASDAEVLRRLDAAPRAYGRLLLRLGVGASLVPVPALPTVAALGAVPTVKTFERRLEMLQHAQETSRRRSLERWLLALALVAALVPVRLVAAAAPAPVAEVAVVQAVAATPVTPVTATTAVTPATPATPTAAVTPAVAAPESRRPADPYVLVMGDHTTANGSTSNVARVKRLAGAGGRLLWFRHGGKEYVVRDAATLEAAQKLFAPQAALGAQQAALGAQQAELGAQQARMGQQAAELGAQQGELKDKLARVAADQAKLGEGEKSAKRRDDLDRQQSGMDGEMADLSSRQDDLGRQQSELGGEQADLGEQQAELGRQQAELSRQAEIGMSQLIDAALAKGLAQQI